VIEVRLRLAVGVLALLTLLSACTSAPAKTGPAVTAPTSAVPSSPSGDAVAASAPPWVEPAKYDFVLDRRCNRGPSIGRYRVSVANGDVVKADRIDGRPAADEEEIEVPSLRGLLDLAQTAADDGGEVTTKLDPADGHPVEVSFNLSGEAADGASCFIVSDYKPAG
jgi:hypothetical protein